MGPPSPSGNGLPPLRPRRAARGADGRGPGSRGRGPTHPLDSRRQRGKQLQPPSGCPPGRGGCRMSATSRAAAARARRPCAGCVAVPAPSVAAGPRRAWRRASVQDEARSPTEMNSEVAPSFSSSHARICSEASLTHSSPPRMQMLPPPSQPPVRCTSMYAPVSASTSLALALAAPARFFGQSTSSAPCIRNFSMAAILSASCFGPVIRTELPSVAALAPCLEVKRPSSLRASNNRRVDGSSNSTTVS
mmetsp:Transcript_19439/g.49788  ORF Transcript_19439/g.49788 Transcript_19439/m.49788 type:complete len:248 (-) Transcript_19439:446-1189(-)